MICSFVHSVCDNLCINTDRKGFGFSLWFARSACFHEWCYSHMGKKSLIGVFAVLWKIKYTLSASVAIKRITSSHEQSFSQTLIDTNISSASVTTFLKSRGFGFVVVWSIQVCVNTMPQSSQQIRPWVRQCSDKFLNSKERDHRLCTH